MSDGRGAEDVLYMWTICERPADYPTSYVVRRWAILSGGGEGIPDPEPACIAPSLALARKFLPPFLTRLPRQAGDDKPVVETWF